MGIRFEGDDLFVPGKLVVGGQRLPAFQRTELQQEDLAVFPINFALLRVWDNLEKAYTEQLVILGRVMGRVKGGLAVDVGVEGFMPGSQVDPRPVHHLDAFIGQDVPVKIIKVNRRRGNVVLSRKLAVEEEVNQRKSATLEQLQEGAVVTGVVKNLTDYGAFIDLGGLDGLLHVTDMSYGRVTHPSEIVHVGDTRPGSA